MRSDYILYVVAVLCFIIAGVFIAGAIPLGTSEMILTATAIFFILGIIFAVGGYALRPKAAAPMPTVYQPPPQQPPVEEKIEEAPAVTPPVVEAPPPVEEAPVVEHIPPPAEEMAPTKPTSVPTLTESGKCPKCGTEVSSPKKKWTMAGRPDKSGMRMQLEIGLFDCPKCHKPFRVVLSQKKV